MAMVKLVSQCFIKAKYQVEQLKEPHYLAPDDLIMLSLQYMQKGLLFIKPPNFNADDLNSFLEKLKYTLSLALVYFYPLAGRLATKRYEDEHCCWIYVDCHKGPGARFLHAEVDVTVSDVILSTASVLSVIQSLFDLGEKGIVNHDGHTRALLSVQVTELVDGVFIGFAMNHCVADGTSLWHFINTMSEIYKSDGGEHMIPRITRVPIYKPSRVEGIGPIITLPYLNPVEFITWADPDLGLQLREKIFHFSATSMISLKAKVKMNADCDAEVYKISSFQSLSAYVWKSIAWARNLPPDIETSCSLVVNSRPRFDPPLSPEYFGNFGLMAQGRSKVSELLGNGLGSAALLLHQAVAAQDDRAARGALNAYI